MATPLQLTRTHRILVGVVVAGAVVIAGIGFAGSYAAVRELAQEKGFGNFSVVFPIGIDAGICVLLALDLLLTWIRIPFPLLRQTAWLLTAATIAFNGATAWPDPLGVGMHAVIPILFVVSVEAARHAVGRIADITADKHMEGVRLTRWLLSPIPTFRLWRRMKLWELRRYDEVIRLEQDRLIYQARLQARYGRAWRRKAPVESLMPLRLAKYGVPLADTAPAGLAAAGIETPFVSVVRVSDAAAEADGQQLSYPVLDSAPGSEESWLTGQQVHDGDLERPAYGFVPGPRAAEAEAEPMHRPVEDEPTFAEAAVEETRAHRAEDLGFPGPEHLDANGAEFAGPVGPVRSPEPAFSESSLEVFSVEAEQPLEPVAVQETVAPAAAAHEGVGVGGQQTSLDVLGVAGDPLVWEGAVAEAGAATARVPEERQEPEVDAEERRVRTVAGWLAEAEAEGKKLSGAEVARRLEVSPSTGQRALRNARKFAEEQARTQGRARLRSVNGRS
ncbi:DUF2637 domain-containing protein [Streptomyces sp. NBC_01465]|uniref:DUF2637 domain-containing protein n=1 Tax=Streptomyces sp. NBC_01465 TaxID=2903878 RepID=UPI002E30E0FE|nr:DUF2637 domain-containing protein [Streptomyces sp. NBC_01465]